MEWLESANHHRMEAQLESYRGRNALDVENRHQMKAVLAS